MCPLVLPYELSRQLAWGIPPCPKQSMNSFRGFHQIFPKHRIFFRGIRCSFPVPSFCGECVSGDFRIIHSMKVRLAKTAGFCMGVKRAVDRVLEVTQRGGRKVYTYGPLIHNPQAVRMIEQRGAVAREEFAEPEKATVVIRAHGVPPKTREHLESLGLEVLDAT